MDIKTVIRSHGYTLEKVAAEWKDKNGQHNPITKGALSKSINNNPTIATLQGIADVIGCKVGDFFRDEIETDTAHSSFVCPKCGARLRLVEDSETKTT
jgi:hypothetical protein